MSRAEKIKKLANAIREYRGLTATPPGAVKVVWSQPPQPAAGPRVVKYLTALGLDPTKNFLKVNSFTKVSEFNAWLKSLEQPENEHLFNRKAIA